MKKNLKFFIFLLIPLIFLLIIGEIACKIYDHFAKKNKIYPDLSHLEPYLMFSPKPNQTINLKYGVLKINSLGFRGEEISPVKSDSTYRIALLGGSVGFNGNSDSTTIIGFVEQLLEKSINKVKYANIETINAAVPGYISTQEMLVLILKLVDLEPDLVIIFDGVNDWSPFLTETRIGYPVLFSNLEKAVAPPSFAKAFNETIQLSSLFSHFKKWTISLVNISRKNVKKVLPAKAVEEFKIQSGLNMTFSEEKKQKAINLYINNHIKMEYICRIYNINCIHINQPNAVRKKDLTKFELDSFNNTFGSEIFLMESDAIAEMNALKEMDSFLFYDFGDIFDNEKGTIFKDFCHFVDTDYANHLIAEKIVKIIYENNLIK